MRELLQAELPGTRVTNQGSIQVFILGRDIGSCGISKNNGAVTFVLDGMIVRDIDVLNPRDVRSIRLLRGHEASGMYGSLGANGVILIHTK
jgi:TonB-dependent SusC/RagA subfamily outer membrane receptor